MEMMKDITWIQIVYALFLVLAGFLFAKWLSILSENSMLKRLSRHQAMLLRRVIFYGLFILFLVSALHQIGFQLGVLLGAAGIFTVAIGFASQTAASNLISGIFLLIEHPFQVGDLIEVNNMTGNIDSIDLLSTKIRTADNTLIRLPNETLIKSAITNFSSLPTRRADILIGVSYDTDINLAKNLLIKLAGAHEKVLAQPEPQVIINNFADSAIELKLMCWAKTTDNSTVKNELKENIKMEFDKANVDIPFPQMTLHRA
ncbi:mechanosensitive ion channel family protein [Legionella israelensis]|uniref:Small-conductance mechanosensitive channel n=1 Tax=Legionella israelensis TaxID=454 RepID=A0AAX1EET3_9GAMM|nr:mechanosensitive ion channel family protein [Legionella israelensis]QBR83334.1 mechanosensitive ion channel family protein [Legionella israelensis]